MAGTDQSDQAQKTSKDWGKIADREEISSESAEQQQTHAGAENEDILNATQATGEELSPEQKELAKAKEEVLRLMAEISNTKKRANEDIEKAKLFAAEKFLTAMLPVADSLEIGLAKLYEGGDTVPKAVVEGTELTVKMMLDTLHRFGVQQINPIGEPFDPHFHEAMAMRPEAGKPDNQVIEVLQKGYSLNGRVVRAALVVVAKNNS